VGYGTGLIESNRVFVSLEKSNGYKFLGCNPITTIAIFCVNRPYFFPESLFVAKIQVSGYRWLQKEAIVCNSMQ
jgi:hypothetical protein